MRKRLRYETTGKKLPPLGIITIWREESKETSLHAILMVMGSPFYALFEPQHFHKRYHPMMKSPQRMV